MSFWLMAASAGQTPETIKQQSWIAKPGFDAIDYSKVRARKEVKQHLQTLDEDAPPESLALHTQAIWQFIHAIDVEDIIAVVWSNAGKAQGVCFAEVTGKIFAEPVGENLFEHRLPIRWYAEQAGILRLRPFAYELEKAGPWPSEIDNAKFKLALRNHLPLPGNKFVKWKWLIVVVICIKLLMITMNTLKRSI